MRRRQRFAQLAREAMAKVMPPKRENYCAECDREFKTPAALKAHNTRMHK